MLLKRACPKSKRKTNKQTYICPNNSKNELYPMFVTTRKDKTARDRNMSQTYNNLGVNRKAKGPRP